MKVDAILVLMLLVATALAQKTDCEKFVEKLISDLVDFKFDDLPLPSLMYSGTTTNNPGMMEECTDANFSYFLVSLKFQLRSALPKFDLCAPRLLSHQPTFAP